MQIVQWFFGLVMQIRTMYMSVTTPLGLTFWQVFTGLAFMGILIAFFNRLMNTAKDQGIQKAVGDNIHVTPKLKNWAHNKKV